ncbi:hypothetical protein BKA64DRAFT_704735 [Cadophora sp. MPI-SDFR-AT-0126]|nr:hypothetical protein BKA64DRAFT_704735 [Leotiomycetes sp. MPI-SDFR-AT-0126]
MSLRRTKSMSETANRSVTPAPNDLSRGMYTDGSIASMTPAHTRVESKVKAPANSVAGMGIISNPLCPRRSNRLAGISPTAINSLDFDSPSCPPSLKAAASRRMTTRAMRGKLAKASKVMKNTGPAKKLLPTAAVSKASEKKYAEIMRTHSAPAVAISSSHNINSINGTTQRSRTGHVSSPPLPVSVATHSKSKISLSFKKLPVRSKT